MVRTQIIAFTDNLWWGPGTQFFIIIISVKKKHTNKETKTKKERKKREEKRTRKRKEKERKNTKQAKEKDHWKLFFSIFFFILINQIGGNLDSSVVIAPNQDVDISVSISLGPRSASLQKRAHSKTSIVKMQISEKWRQFPQCGKMEQKSAWAKKKR